jgi:hypothetical protein
MVSPYPVLFGLALELVCCVIGILVIRRGVKDLRLGHPGAWLLIAGALIIAAPLVVALVLRLTSGVEA